MRYPRCGAVAAAFVGISWSKCPRGSGRVENPPYAGGPFVRRSYGCPGSEESLCPKRADTRVRPYEIAKVMRQRRPYALMLRLEKTGWEEGIHYDLAALAPGHVGGRA